MNRKFKLFALIAAIVFTLVFMGTTVAAYDVVQPDGSYCLDKVGVISDSTKTYITERNKNLEQNCKGAQMCVVVLDSIGFGTDIEEYASDVFSSWQIGRSGEDNGVLFLMLIGDQNYWIMPGTGLENVLSTAALSTVINVYCEPNFAQGDYDTAVLKTFTRLNELICQDYGVNPEGSASGSGSFVGGNNGGGTDINNGNGNGIGNSLYGRSCSDVHLPHYYSCASCDSCRSCASCSSCLFSCGYCGGGCGSCTGFWGMLVILFIIYVILQVLRGMGRGVHRVNRSPGGVYYGPRVGGPGPGPRPGGYTSGPRPSGGSTSHSSGSGRPGFGGFSGGGGSSRGGGVGRPGGSFGGGSRSSGGSGRPGGFGGFSGGGGSSRGGGAGRK